MSARDDALAVERRERRDRALAWAASDPDPATADALRELVRRADDGEDDARAELDDAFDGTLAFGTAGLRGRLGPGPNRMNRVVVARAAAGLVRYLLDREGGPDSPPHVVVGYDARHGSHRFALDTVAVAVGAGLSATLLPRALPTPVLAFAVRHLGADAGVMVTASHNPPQDNGYKVYLGGPGEDGAQIVPPADADIAAQIAQVGDVTDPAAVPMAVDGWDVADEALVDAYVAAAAEVAGAGGPRDLSVVLTPLHGVGGPLVETALRAAGFTHLRTVAEQSEPDPDFPTTPFPNPEEDGALDLALALARRVSADVVVANDPDADRCAVAVPLRPGDDPEAGPGVGDGEDGPGWRALTGDEVGALLGHHLAERGLPPGSVLARSVVSSDLLAKVAQAHGLESAVALTGFKWISRVPGLAFGYEEALGYCVDPAAVRDKDGISAAVLVCELAAAEKARGRGLLDVLDDLARAHGLHATAPLTLRVEDLSLIADAMARLRAEPPTSLAGNDVTSTQDLSAGGAQDGVELPPTDGLVYRTADGARVVVRPSGTEPKLKCYCEVVVPVAVDADAAAVAGARRDAAERLDALRADLRRVLDLPA
ncbi:phospho-sugar mutase [Pseudokineococcus basanitobsidens]|uniref:Phospho-sugar mutase n=1 Tax=Pseudokineococcus basanitobsidens TaxID=1926649 RepID=A0ABU8RL90_9ACTN